MAKRGPTDHPTENGAAHGATAPADPGTTPAAAADPGTTPADPGTVGAAPAGDEAADLARYEERLTVPWWLWLVVLAFTAATAAEIDPGAGNWFTVLPYALLLPPVAIGLFALGRLRVAVADGELIVDDARLPIRYVAGVTPLDSEQKRLLLGPAADPYAFVVQRPWIRGTIQVHLDDPDDPTPYWVISSRRPRALAAALIRARGAGPTPR